MKITEARKTKVITPTNFRWYDVCCNPYVGCEHGCAYCYVQFFIKDPEAWGQFVRVREHIKTKLDKELKNIKGKRICIGTFTDPYQPAETTYRLTRHILTKLIGSGSTKTGVYTKSPLVLEDLDLFKKGTNANLHMTITPIHEKYRSLLEHAQGNIARFDVVRKFTQAGIRVYLNIAPIVPIISDGLAETILLEAVQSNIHQFFVDPMMPYKQSVINMSKAGIDCWNQISPIITDKEKYAKWKAEQRKIWMDAWKKVGNQTINAIWSDHENKVTEDMNTGLPVDPRKELA